MRTAVIFVIFITLISVRLTGRAATEIPFAYEEGLIFLKIHVAGENAPLNFVVDSGAGASVLDVEAARKLKLQFGRRETVQGVEGRCVAFRMKGLNAKVAGIPVARSMLALDLSPVSRSCGKRIDGLLGADFFNKRIVQIDFAAQKIRLVERGEVPSNSAQIVPLAKRNDALCVQIGVNGNAPQWMRLDTGCSSALEWVSGRPWARSSGTAATIAAAAGSKRSIYADVTIGSERFTDVKTGLHDKPLFSGEAGLLGNGLLSRFLVTVDAGKEQLLLTRIK